MRSDEMYNLICAYMDGQLTIWEAHHVKSAIKKYGDQMLKEGIESINDEETDLDEARAALAEEHEAMTEGYRDR